MPRMRLRRTSTHALLAALPSTWLAALLLLGAAGCASDASKARDALARGKQLVTAHDLDAAATQLAAASTLDPKLHEAFARLARVRLEQSRAPDAETAALRAASLVPRSAYYSELLGRAQLASGKTDAALASLEQAITLDPTQTARLAFTVGAARERVGKPVEALAAYDRAATADVNAVLPRIALARLLLDAERLRDAEHRLDEARPHVAAEGNEHTLFAALDARITTLVAAKRQADESERQRLANVGIFALLGPSVDGPGDHLIDADAIPWGDTIGDAFGSTGGSNELGLTGSGGSGGYGDRTIGLGSAGTIGLGHMGSIGPGYGGGGSGASGGLGGLGRSGAIPNIAAGTPTVAGTLPPEVIRRIVRRNINELRVCYETALARNPALAGRVSLTFTITPTGATEQTSATGLGDAAAETCMATSVSRWMFPMPDGGGAVRVSYPLTLAPPAAAP